MLNYVFFFFQAEDGIRDLIVTGVQTCALPISASPASATCSRCKPSAPLSSATSMPPRLERRQRSCFPKRARGSPAKRFTWIAATTSWDFENVHSRQFTVNSKEHGERLTVTQTEIRGSSCGYLKLKTEN